MKARRIGLAPMHQPRRSLYERLYERAAAAKAAGVPVTISEAEALALTPGDRHAVLASARRRSAAGTLTVFGHPARIRPLRRAA